MGLADSRDKTTLIVTGASGLVGGYFINAVRERYYIHAIARRGQSDTEVPVHENVNWHRCDIRDGKQVSRLVDYIGAVSRVDFLFHFAGYYDFTNRHCDDYRRTNVDGTRHVLEGAARLGVKRFIFSSSLAVSEFAGASRTINEETPPDADYPYARSKRQAEELVRSFSTQFPCTIARLAALYSDWCEYAPLYVMLNALLGDGWRSRLVAGKGETALPYLHVQDVNAFWLKTIENHELLGNLDVLAASPNGCVAHNDIFAAAKLGWDGGEGGAGAIRVPVWLATTGLALRLFLGRCIGRPPFERPWMMRYIDKQMRIDAWATHDRLGWSPRRRYHLLRRLPYLIENMKRNPAVWERRNLAMTKQTVAERQGLRIYNAMGEVKESVIDAHVAYLTAGRNKGLFPHYCALAPAELRLRAELAYQMLESSIRLGVCSPLFSYANYLARCRLLEGIRREELTGALENLAARLEQQLENHPGLAGLRKRIYFEIGVKMQIILDEIEETYENLSLDGQDSR